METTEHVTSAAAGERSRPGGLVLTALTLGFAVIQLDVSVVNVAVKAIGTGLGGGVSGVQWVVDAYTLTFAALILSARSAIGSVPGGRARAGGVRDAGYRQARPMVPLSLFRTPTFSVTVATGFLINVVFYGLIFVFSLFLQRQDGLSPLAAGLAFVPVTVTVMVINGLSGRFPGARWFPGTRGAIAGGALLMAAGCCVIAAAPPAPVAIPVAGLSVAGLGIGLIVPAITAALLGSVDRSWSGTASGTLTALRQTGSVLGVAVFGSLVVGRGITAGLHLACEISVGLAALVALLSLGTARRGEGR